MTSFALQDKVAIVTGGAGAIGSATATLLVQRGTRVLVADNNWNAAQAIAELLGERARVHTVDLSKPAECRETITACIRHFGQLDLLINNVGICPRRSIAESSEQDWDSIVGVNQKSMFFCSQAAIPELKKTKGSIVSVASYAGRAGAALDACIYSGTKGAIIAMTKSMARELAPDIRVNAVAPGAVETELVKNLPPKKIEAICESIPLRRLAQAVEVAKAICFLASPDSSYMTGVTLDVNGGWYMA